MKKLIVYIRIKNSNIPYACTTRILRTNKVKEILGKE